MAEHEAQHLAETAVDQLEVALEGQIVGHVELADPGCIAAAAEILEQQRVVELLQFVIGHADLAADMGADVADADAVAGRLALGQVERLAQRLDDVS